MNLTARSLSTQVPAVQAAPTAPTSIRLRVSARRRASAVDIDGKAMTTMNCGRKSTAFVTIRAPAYRPATLELSTLPATITSALDSTKNASNACELCSVSRMIGRAAWSAMVCAASRSRRRAYQPTRQGATRPMATAIMALASVGRHRMKAVPITKRGTPTAM